MSANGPTEQLCVGGGIFDWKFGGQSFNHGQWTRDQPPARPLQMKQHQTHNKFILYNENFCRTYHTHVYNMVAYNKTVR